MNVKRDGTEKRHLGAQQTLLGWLLMKVRWQKRLLAATAVTNTAMLHCLWMKVSKSVFRITVTPYELGLKRFLKDLGIIWLVKILDSNRLPLCSQLWSSERRITVTQTQDLAVEVANFFFLRTIAIYKLKKGTVACIWNDKHKPEHIHTVYTHTYTSSHIGLYNYCL